MAATLGLMAVISSVALAAGPPAGPSRQAQGRLAPPSDPARITLPRTGEVTPVARSVEGARAGLRSGLGRQAMLTVDDRTGGVKAVGRLDGFLTGSSGRDAKDVALGWVRDHADAMGLGARDLDALRLVRDYTSFDGVRHLQWAQVVDGITVVDSGLQASVASDGRLINVLGGARGGLALPSVAPAITAKDAYARTLRSVGSRASVPAVRSARATGSRMTSFAGDGQAQLVAYGAGGGLRLAWRVLAPVGADGDYDGLIDARTGRLVGRANMVKFANALVMDNEPGSDPGGTQHETPIGQWLDPGATALIGDNAHAFLDVRDEVGPKLNQSLLTDHFTPPADGDVPPSNGTDWLYPIQTVPDAAGFCPSAPPGCTWNHTTPDSWQVNKNQATTQLFYYVNKYHDHLLAPPIGFDEASGNFQQTNASGQGKGGDPVWAQSDDGADTEAGLPDQDHQDNANFDTRPDGAHPGLMQMYLWELALGGGFVLPYATVNGTDDPTIVYHEYTHGLSNRLITDPQGFGAVAGVQSGAMGEAWSDWYALDFLVKQGYLPDSPAPGDIVEGAYVENGFNLVRSEPTDCPPDQGSDACPGFPETGPGGYTYADFGEVLAGNPGGSPLPEVHYDGEIWAQTLWQLRQALVNRYGQEEGARRAELYVTSGMRLGPANPSFLDQRNAILQAATVAGGQDQALIWQVFASRGMGYFASTRGDFDFQPDADFSLPPAGTADGVVQGVVRDDSGQPVPRAVVGLSGHDGPPSAGPALQGVTDADGAYKIAGIPAAEYPELIVHPGPEYAELFGGPVSIAGGTITKDLTVRRNWASSRGPNGVAGATITSDARDDTQFGCGFGNLIDGLQATVLETASPDNPDTLAVESAPRRFTVFLPEAQAVDGAEVWIDPSSGCGALQGSALGEYTLEVSMDRTNFIPVADGLFRRADIGRLNRVPVKGMPAGVQAVRLVARSTQGSFRGNPGSILDDFGVLDIAELQVYARPSGTAGGPPTTTPGPAPKAAELKPDLSKTARRLKVSRSGRVMVRLRCIRATAGALPKRCTGIVSLARSGGKPLGKRRSFDIPVNSTKRIAIELSSRARRQLRRHPVKARITATVKNPGGATRTAHRSVRIRKMARRP